MCIVLIFSFIFRSVSVHGGEVKYCAIFLSDPISFEKICLDGARVCLACSAYYCDHFAPRSGLYRVAVHTLKKSGQECQLRENGCLTLCLMAVIPIQCCCICLHCVATVKQSLTIINPDSSLFHSSAISCENVIRVNGLSEVQRNCVAQRLLAVTMRCLWMHQHWIGKVAIKVRFLHTVPHSLLGKATNVNQIGMAGNLFLLF